MVGCRFSLYPMTDDFVRVILSSLDQAKRDGLQVDTDDVSTYVTGDEDTMLSFVQDVLVAASRQIQHVVCTLLLSRGCPGEEECEIDPSAPWPEPHVRRTPGAPTGVRAAAHFSLYPLGIENYMDVIYREIGRIKQSGVFARGEHFASRLEGDISEVLGAIQDCWDRAEAETRHVVAHATISVGSPTLKNNESNE